MSSALKHVPIVLLSVAVRRSIRKLSLMKSSVFSVNGSDFVSSGSKRNIQMDCIPMNGFPNCAVRETCSLHLVPRRAGNGQPLQTTKIRFPCRTCKSAQTPIERVTVLRHRDVCQPGCDLCTLNRAPKHPLQGSLLREPHVRYVGSSLHRVSRTREAVNLARVVHAHSL